MIERRTHWFINDRFTIYGIKFGDGIMASLSSDKESAQWPWRAYFCASILWAEFLAGGEGGEIGSVAFASVIDLESSGSECFENVLKLWDYFLDGREIVSERGKVSSRIADWEWIRIEVVNFGKKKRYVNDGEQSSFFLDW